MRFSTLALAASAGLVSAQRPANTSVCDYYTTALLKENTPANQYTILTLVVNTVVIGNYTPELNKGIKVPGILAPGEFNGTKVNLLPYFDGSLKSSNRGGMAGVSINFLDDGGAAPLMKNMPSAGNMTSQQYKLLTHLYSFFGNLLGCSGVGQMGFAAYGGSTNMYAVHKFMDLNPAEVGYFITQVGLSAASFGVATEDVTAVGMALNKLFNYRCSAPAAILPQAAVEPQSICINAACPLAMNATCAAYQNVTAPAFVNGTVVAAPGSSNASSTSTTNQTSSGSGSGSGSGSSSSSSTPNSGTMIAVSGTLATAVFGLVGFAAFLL